MPKIITPTIIKISFNLLGLTAIFARPGFGAVGFNNSSGEANGGLDSRSDFMVRKEISGGRTGGGVIGRGAGGTVPTPKGVGTPTSPLADVGVGGINGRGGRDISAGRGGTGIGAGAEKDGGVGRDGIGGGGTGKEGRLGIDGGVRRVGKGGSAGGFGGVGGTTGRLAGNPPGF